MAKLELKNSTTVGEFSAAFHEAFGAQVRVYNGRSRAEDGDVLGNLGLTNELKPWVAITRTESEIACPLNDVPAALNVTGMSSSQAVFMMNSISCSLLALTTSLGISL